MVYGKALEVWERHRIPGLLFDDVLQETWTVFLKCVAGHTPDKGRITTYFYGAMRHEGRKIPARAVGMRTYHRIRADAEFRTACYENPGFLEEVTPSLQRAPSPLQMAADSEKLDHIADWVLALAPIQQDILRLMLEGLSPKSIAAELHLYRSWVEREKVRLLVALREIV